MNVAQTERLTLRELGPGDAEFILELLNTPSWKRFIGDRGVTTVAEAEQFIRNRMMKSYMELGFGFFRTALKENDIPIGICGMVKRDTLDHTDLGFAFLPEYEGKGYGMESSLAMLEYARTVHGLKKIAAITNRDNERSISLLRKLGFQFEKLVTLPGESMEIMLFLKSFEPA
ncbi:MAG: GNAT family N-acetyltransferase [Bacteroidia bacterium]